LLAFRSGFDPIGFENVFYSGVGNVVADIRQCSLNSIATPGRILLRESQNQIDDHLSDARPADCLSLVAAVPFPGNQVPLPTQNRIGREQCTEFFQQLTAEDLAFDAKTSPLIVVE
jgi:hypothetical protein